MVAIRRVIFYFLGWNYLCLGIEPLFELSIFTAVDKVKDRILYNKVWKDNWTYWDTCQYYIIYCSIDTIWVHFKRNYNLFDRVLINVITFDFFFFFIWMIVITSYFKLDPSFPIFDHMNSSLFDELILIKD
jgi:hypothetical protein